MNFIVVYQVNAFGNDLISQQSQLTQPFSSALWPPWPKSGQTGWNVGFNVLRADRLPLGLAAGPAIRGASPRPARHWPSRKWKSRTSWRSRSRTWPLHYQTAQSYFNRRVAAERSRPLYQYQYEVGTTTLAFVLQAQSSLASAEQNYYTSLASYAQAIIDLQFRKGTLLDYHNVSLAESEWTPEAYRDAVRDAWARAHAIPAGHLQKTEPAEVGNSGTDCRVRADRWANRLG